MRWRLENCRQNLYRGFGAVDSCPQGKQKSAQRVVRRQSDLPRANFFNGQCFGRISRRRFDFTLDYHFLLVSSVRDDDNSLRAAENFRADFHRAECVLFLVDALVLTLHRSLFDKSMFQVLLDTNWQEAVEFVDNYSTLISAKIFWIVPLAAGFVLCFKVTGVFIDLVLNCRPRFVRGVMIFGLLFAAMIFLDIAPSYTFFPRIGISVVRMTVLVERAFNEIREYQEVYKNIDATQTKITRNDSRLPWVIFILGESTGRAHMSLYGYDKPTNPNLQRRLEQNEFVLFSDCISGGDLTMLSCERLFTFYDNRVADNGKPWYLYPNLFDILKAAGYHTVWLSNQESSGIYGNVPRAYADRCDEKNFTVIRDTSTFVYEYDEKLLPLLEDSLKKNSYAKNFYVLHLLGTHADYRLRFPPEFKIFKADDEPAKSAFQREYQADYDNAVLYNDFVVDER